MSITGAAPFGSEADQTLAVAYISAFILVFMVSQANYTDTRFIFIGVDDPFPARSEQVDCHGLRRT